MSSALRKADFTIVTSDRGERIRERFEALGITDREWHRVTGIDRKTLNRATEPNSRSHSSTLTAIEAHLDRLEARNAGEPVAAQPEVAPDLIRIEVQGVYGAKALIVEGSPENQEQLEAMVDRIMRNLRNEPDSPEGV